MCFLLSLDQDNLFQNTIFFHVYNFFVTVEFYWTSNELSMLWMFQVRVNYFIGPYLCCQFTLSSCSPDCCSSSKHSSLRVFRINFFFFTQFIKIITNFIVFTIFLCQPIIISFKTSSNDKTEFFIFFLTFTLLYLSLSPLN